jgi:acyl-CoA thioester hydrolase
MITSNYKIRTRYNEVDQMGYLYHANYVTYCHQARTELMRTLGIHDKALERKGIILPVIEMNLRYLKPAFYDEELCIVSTISDIPKTRIIIDFEIFNQAGEKICKARSTMAIVDGQSRKPMRAPQFIQAAFAEELIKSPV